MPTTVSKKCIAVGSDHTDEGGVLKKAIIEYLISRGIEVVEVKPDRNDPNDDYIDIAIKACEKILDGKADSAILIDLHGVGVNMVANRFLSIRSVVVWGPKICYDITARNNPDVICIPRISESLSGFIEITPEWTIQIVKAWLDTNFLQGLDERKQDIYIGRQRRLTDIGLEVYKLSKMHLSNKYLIGMRRIEQRMGDLHKNKGGAR